MNEEQLEQFIREADLEAGWQRYAGLKWKGAQPTPAERLAARDAFASGLAWMFEVLMNLGERPHEFTARARHVRQNLQVFVAQSRYTKIN